MSVLPDWLRTYSRPRLRLDVVAGLSLAAFAIPESLAYASLADLPPISGLYCYLVAGIAYALFGTCRQLAVGPTSALAIAVAAGIGGLAGGDAARAVALGAGIALIVGVIAIGGRYLGLAQVAYFLSDTVVTGFKTGAAIYIASTQLPKLFGVAGTSGNFFVRIAGLVDALPQAHLPSLVVGVGAIVLFLAFERFLPGRPTTLIVVAGAIAASAYFDLSRFDIHLVGELPLGLPRPGLPDIHYSDLRDLVPTALACFLLAYGESISVARSFAQKHGYEIDPERELTAIGAANLATGLARGFPVAGGMSQSAVNDMGGATSPMSLVVTSLAVALTLLFLAGLFHDLPEPVLGAIVLMAAKHLVKFDELKTLRAGSRLEFGIALIALAGVLVLGLLNGLLLAAVGSLIVMLAKASRPMVVPLARDETGRFVNRERLAAPVELPGVLVVRNSGAWFYFNAEYIRRQILDLVAQAATPVHTVILDCSMVPVIDFNAASVLRSLARTLKGQGTTLWLAELRDDVVEALRASGVEEDTGPLGSHLTIERCVAGEAPRAGIP
jgi:high affinity sulfate transporter 1